MHRAYHCLPLLPHVPHVPHVPHGVSVVKRRRTGEPVYHIQGVIGDFAHVGHMLAYAKRGKYSSDAWEQYVVSS